MLPKPQSQSTAQEFLDIYDITNNFTILKNGTVSIVLVVGAMNFGLLAEAEQDAVIYTYAALLNSLNYPIQIIIQSQTKDVTDYLNLLKQSEEEASSDNKRERISRYRQFVSELIKERNVLDKKFYVVVPANLSELGLLSAESVIPGKTNFDISSIEKSVILEKAEAVLAPKRDHLISQFARIGLYSRQLTTQEIIRVFYTNYNPEASEGQELTDTNQYTTPLVRANFTKSADQIIAQQPDQQQIIQEDPMQQNDQQIVQQQQDDQQLGGVATQLTQPAQQVVDPNTQVESTQQLEPAEPTQAQPTILPQETGVAQPAIEQVAPGDPTELYSAQQVNQETPPLDQSAQVTPPAQQPTAPTAPATTRVAPTFQESLDDFSVSLPKKPVEAVAQQPPQATQNPSEELGKGEQLQTTPPTQPTETPTVTTQANDPQVAINQVLQEVGGDGQINPLTPPARPATLQQTPAITQPEITPPPVVKPTVVKPTATVPTATSEDTTSLPVQPATENSSQEEKPLPPIAEI